MSQGKIKQQEYVKHVEKHEVMFFFPRVFCLYEVLLFYVFDTICIFLLFFCLYILCVFFMFFVIFMICIKNTKTTKNMKITKHIHNTHKIHKQKNNKNMQIMSKNMKQCFFLCVSYVSGVLKY